MVPSSRRAAIRRRLLAWWDAGRRALPWRFPQDAADPYRVWLAEVMLQQTRVEAAIPYYERFLARLPTIEALAAAPEGEVLALWSGLGYYARARNLGAAAREALERHGGLPRSLEALRALPGFGPYTAGAVASIAFALRAPAVDGNVARVLARLFHVDGDPASRGVSARLWVLAGALVPPRRPGDFNQALMDLGATVCGKPVPSCARCPLAGLCLARSAGREREVPRARVRPGRRALHLACALVEDRGRVLLARRPAGGLFGGLWGLPSAEIRPGDGPGAALAEALRVPVRAAREVARVRRTLTHRDLELVAYRCRVARGMGGGAGSCWAGPEDLGRIGVSSAMRALLAAAGVPR